MLNRSLIVWGLPLMMALACSPSTERSSTAGKGGSSSGGSGGQSGKGGAAGGGRGGTAGGGASGQAGGGSGGSAGMTGGAGSGGAGNGGMAGNVAGMAGNLAGMAGNDAGMAGNVAGMAGAAGMTPSNDAGVVDAPVAGNGADGSAAEPDAGAVDAPSAGDAGVADAPASSGLLLAWDDFSTADGALNAVNTGMGWTAAWTVQNSDVMQPGFSVVAASPLTYMNLASTPGHAIGGRAFLSSGRKVDVALAGPFADYLAAGRVGAAGKTLWFSALVRKDADNDDDFKIALHPSGSVIWDGDGTAPGTVAVGFFSPTSKVAGKRMLSLRTLSQAAQVVTPSTVEMVVGQTYLLVVSIDFAATSKVRLWVNPASLGGDAPATPTLEVTTMDNLSLHSLVFYPGNGPASGSLDELRFGTSYSAVTPIK